MFLRFGSLGCVELTTVEGVCVWGGEAESASSSVFNVVLFVGHHFTVKICPVERQTSVPNLLCRETTQTVSQKDRPSARRQILIVFYHISIRNCEQQKLVCCTSFSIYLNRRLHTSAVQKLQQTNAKMRDRLTSCAGLERMRMLG